MTDDPHLTGDSPRLSLDAPLVRQVTEVIRSADAAALRALLREHPGSRPPGLETPATGNPEHCCTC